MFGISLYRLDEIGDKVVSLFEEHVDGGPGFFHFILQADQGVAHTDPPADEGNDEDHGDDRHDDSDDGARTDQQCVKHVVFSLR